MAKMPLGRRFRALKLWFVLRSLGAERMREHLRAGIELRKRFEQHVLDDARLEFAAPPSLSLCCFRLKGESDVNQMAFLRR
jgi:aromatic-L-amino-acid decarboxylase